MHLTGLHLLLTYRCTSECDHCFVWSSPRASGTMPLHLAKNAVRQAAQLGTVREIWIEGGEPFLYYPVLREVVACAHSLGLETGIVTNGYYAVSDSDALAWLTLLKAAGLDRLSISDDSFHGDEFPNTPEVQHLVTAATELSIATDTICVQRPGEGTRTNAKGEPITGGTVRLRGRAAETLLKDQPPAHSWHSFQECPDEDWGDIGRLHLDAYGNLFACQGIVLGNFKRNTLAEAVASYDPGQHPVIAPLRRGGPAELVRAFDLPHDEKYHDACHLCYTARQVLRERFPRELAPAQVYGMDEV